MESIYEVDSFDDFSFNQSLLSDTIKKLSEDIQTSSPLHSRIEKQLDDLFSGKSTTIHIKGNSDTSTRKIRFVNKGFQKKIKKLNEKFDEIHIKSPITTKSSLKKYEALLNLLSKQIEKEEIIFKVTPAKGKAKYGASQRIMEQMKHGGVVSVGKSKKERVYVIGKQEPSGASANKKIKTIDVSVIKSEEFTKAAGMLREVIAQFHTELQSKTTQEKHTAQSTASPSRPALQKHAAVEKTKRSHISTHKKEIKPIRTKQHEKVEDEMIKFAQREKEKDLKAKDKLAKIEANEIEKFEIGRKTKR